MITKLILKIKRKENLFYNFLYNVGKFVVFLIFPLLGLYIFHSTIWTILLRLLLEG